MPYKRFQYLSKDISYRLASAVRSYGRLRRSDAMPRRRLGEERALGANNLCVLYVLAADKTAAEVGSRG